MMAIETGGAIVKICVVGAGSIGGLIAACMAQAGFETSVVARGAHLRAIHGAVGADHAGAEGLGNGRNGVAAGRGERVGDGVGVDRQRAEGAEAARDGALAAADAAGQADPQRARHRVRPTG